MNNKINININCLIEDIKKMSIFDKIGAVSTCTTSMLLINTLYEYILPIYYVPVCITIGSITGYVIRKLYLR